MPDGDCIVLHETAPTVPNTAGPIAVLVHGLGGSHRSPYIVRIAHRLTNAGWHVFRMDLRAAGVGIRFARRFYNAACSADVAIVIEHIAATIPGRPIAVVGFSLGGNIVLKYAGEAAAKPLPTLRAVAALAPPIDLIACSELIARYPFYDAHYVSHLTTQVARHQRYFPDLPGVAFPRRMTLRQFDDLYTAPRGGYADALDYYRQASSFRLIPAIRRPTLILTSRDDPFIAVEPFEALHAAPPVEVNISEHGGHLGFLGSDGAGGIRWAESLLVDWLANSVKAHG